MLMKFIVNTVLIALLSFVAALFCPFWIIAPVAFVVSLLIPMRPLMAFASGFLALFLLWGGLALAANLSNGGILATRMASVLPLGGSPYLLIVVTGVVGALVGGGGALTAAFLRNAR